MKIENETLHRWGTFNKKSRNIKFLKCMALSAIYAKLLSSCSKARVKRELCARLNKVIDFIEAAEK